MVELPAAAGDIRHRHPGSAPQSPTIVLLHALGCTGLLTLVPGDAAAATQAPRGDPRPALARTRDRERDVLARRLRRRRRRARRGARPDDVIVAGYSMGGIVARGCGASTPGSVEGLVLGATTDRFQLSPMRAASSPAWARHAPPTRHVPPAARAVRAARVAAPDRSTSTHRHARVGAARVPHHQPVGRGSGAGSARPAPLGSVDRSHRRTDRVVV